MRENFLIIKVPRNRGIWRATHGRNESMRLRAELNKIHNLGKYIQKVKVIIRIRENSTMGKVLDCKDLNDFVRS